METMHGAHDSSEDLLVPLPIAYLQLYVATARSGNLTRTAEALAITQSTATRWLQAIERAAGATLFERGAGGLRLTALGSTFLPYAERSARALEEGLQHVRDVQAGRAGTVRLGCSEVTSTYFLPRVLLGFRHEHPNVDVRLRTGPLIDITHAVAEGDLDIAFVPSVEDARLEALLVEADAHVFVAAPGDDVANHLSVGLAELAARGVILFNIGEPGPRYGLEPFMAAHLTPRVVMEVDSVETAKRMVFEGFGVALLPRMAVVDDLTVGRLAAVDLEGVDLGHWHVRMVRRRHQPPQGSDAVFWNWCVERLPASHPHP